MVFRFLHLADLHLETHFGGRPEARERLRRATLEAFGRAADFALEERLDAVLIAGDLFDDALLSVRTELGLLREVRRLAEGGVSFLYASGNHDPGAATRRAAQLGLSFDTPEEGWKRRVHLFLDPAPRPIVVKDADGEPVGVVVGAGHGSDREERNLAAQFRKQATDLPVVGLLHTQVESARSAENHDRYAPSSPQDYERLGYAYWALGHVHVRQQAVPGLPVWYSGNLQGRHARETGPKGGLLVESDAGAAAEPVFVPFAPVRWEKIPFEVPRAWQTLEELANGLAARVAVEQESSVEELALVLELSGETPLAPLIKDDTSRSELEEHLIERTGAVEIELRPHSLGRRRLTAELRSTPTVLSHVLELLVDARQDPKLLEQLAPTSLAGWQEEGDPVEGARDAYLLGLLDGLEDELLERCLREDEA